MEKKLCKVHFFRYSGVECPFCLEERTERLRSRYEQEKECELIPDSPKKDRLITKEMIEKLKNKFS